MNRRNFLRHSMAAVVSTGVGYPLGKFVAGVNQRVDADIEPDNNLSWDDENQMLAQKLMDTYEIPTIEQAERLRQDINSQIATYYAGGALAGSAFRSVNNEIWPETRRHIWHRVVNVFAGGGFARVASWGTRQISDTTNVQSLSDYYGMPHAKAKEFSRMLKKRVRKGRGRVV